MEIEVTEGSFVSEVYHWLRKEGLPAVAQVRIPGVRGRVDLLVMDRRPVVVEVGFPGVEITDEDLRRALRYVRAIIEWNSDVEPAAIVTNLKEAWYRDDPLGEWEKEELEDPTSDLIVLVRRLARAEIETEEQKGPEETEDTDRMLP
ncbi:Uncharacterized protein MK1179 [Methanopyrus kandleri AV19]|uniref:Uncharacterized protein n=1 Tax=Methanopyrus kandleri (strain AV19 / DSM 6324 / JCM 9639 / NBRC 100938) TaxID=190192 RepID=Q8TW57_METKA|nr:Uncharacterized protein MK1179 [Methanopyrus kandleri AV19]